MKQIGNIVLRGLSALLRSREFLLGAAVMLAGIYTFTEQWYALNANRPDMESAIVPVDQVAFKTLQLFIMESGMESDYNSWSLIIARLCACAFILVTAFQILTTLFREAFDAFRLQLLLRHKIVCGFGQIGRQLTNDLTVRWSRRRSWFPLMAWLFPGVVVIEADGDSSDVAKFRLRGGLVVTGDATNEEILNSVGILHASQIFIATGNDASNVEIAFDCIYLLRKDLDRGRRLHSDVLECFVQLGDPTVREVFRSQCQAAIDGLAIRVRDFNPAGNCGRNLVCRTVLCHRPTTQREVALYVFIGFGASGQSMALQIAELAHFENRKRARMLIVERDCENLANRFRAQFGAFTHAECFANSYADVEFYDSDDDWGSRQRRPDPSYQVEAPGVEYACNAMFVERPDHVSDRSFQNMLNRVTSGENVKPIVIVCNENARENLDVAGLIADSLEAWRDEPLPMYVWLPNQPALYSALSFAECTTNSYSNPSKKCTLHPFGDCAESASIDTLFDRAVERIAKRMREKYFESLPPDPHGPRPVPWEEASEIERRWNLSPAAHAIIKKEMNESLQKKHSVEDIGELLAEVEHNRWMAERLLAGWRFDPKLDKCRERNHRRAFVPWRDPNVTEYLPEQEKQKDREQVDVALQIVITEEYLFG